MSRRTITLFTAVLLLAAARSDAQTQAPSPAPASPSAETPTVKVTPYGVVYFNGFNNSGGTNNTDIPLWAAPGTGDTSATARQSRFGIRVIAPGVLGAKATCLAEADFFGGFPATPTGENFGQLRLRLAYARLDWANTTLTLGQDWMVFAPGNPTSLASAAIPLFAAGGNPWARLPQIKLESRFGAGSFQAAVLAPQTGDFASTFLAQPNSGALSETPFFQGRLALASKNWLRTGKPASIGVSGHYGRSRVTPSGGPTKDIDSAGGALDWSVPLGSPVLLTGKAFAGTNLAGFQAGIFQGINPDAVTPASPAGTPQGISTKGGWGQIVVNPRQSRVFVLAGYGFEEPKEGDLRSATVRNWRLRNQVAALGFTYRASAALSFGVEYRLLETKLLQSGTQKDRHLNLAAVFFF